MRRARSGVSDITCIHTKEHFVYLTSVIDLYDRKVVGWSLSDNLTARDTAVRAYLMAVKNRKTSAGMIFHSDRGVQYAGEEFRSEIKGQVVQSMSRNRRQAESRAKIAWAMPRREGGRPKVNLAAGTTPWPIVSFGI